MKRSVHAVIACLSLMGCDLVGPGDDEPRFLLEVTERSATTLTLRWPSMGTPDTYTVDHLTGVARCEDWPPHPNILPVTGTTITVTGLAPSTRYHIHVHLLPHSDSASTNTVFVETLAAGSDPRPVAAAEYESCTGQS